MSGDRTRRTGARWGERKIRRGGRVKWHGVWYNLDDSPGKLSPEQYAQIPDAIRANSGNCPRYDGRMDGMTGLFYDYGFGHHATGSRLGLHSIVGVEFPGPQCVAGVFVWDDFLAERE